MYTCICISHVSAAAAAATTTTSTTTATTTTLETASGHLVMIAVALRERLNPKVVGECIPFGNDPRKCFRPSSHDRIPFGND